MRGTAIEFLAFAWFGWIHAGNAASRAIAARAGLTDYGFGEAGHWKGEPMHCYADREPAFGQGTP